MASTHSFPQPASGLVGSSPHGHRRLDRDGRGEAELELTLPATPASLAQVRAAFEPFLAAQLATHGASTHFDDIVVALGEAVSNVVRHAYADRAEAGAMRVRGQVTPWLLRLEVVDEGPGYDFAAVPRPDFEQPRPGGYGLHLMRETMSRVSYQRAQGRNTLLLEKALRAR